MNEITYTSRDVVRKLIEHIRENHMTNGDRLPPIPQLSDLWGIGRNVVRDGLLQAQSMGIIRIHPRLGTFIQSPDLSPLVDALAETLDLTLMQDDQNLLHLIEARYITEKELAALAASRRHPDDMFIIHQALEEMNNSTDDRQKYIEADEKFHMGIAKASGNPVLGTFLRALLVLLRPYRMSTLLSTEDVRKTNRVHEQIYQSLAEGDTALACSQMEEHLVHSRIQILERLSIPVDKA